MTAMTVSWSHNLHLWSIHCRKALREILKTFVRRENQAYKIRLTIAGCWGIRVCPKRYRKVTSWWLNQPIWKILVKMDHFPKFRGENIKYLSCHHIGNNEHALFFSREKSAFECQVGSSFLRIGVGIPESQCNPMKALLYWKTNGLEREHF